MKKFRLLPWIFLAVLTGCVSPTITTYQTVTPAQLKQRIADDTVSRDNRWNIWKYAGSDDNYDYVYEYNPGSTLPYTFYGYRLPKGEIDVGRPYSFNPSYDENRPLW